MPNLLRWRTRLGAPDAQAQLDELRASTLRLFLALTAASYLVWHYLNTAAATEVQVTRVYAVAPAVMVVLGATYLFLPRSLLAAAVTFVGGAALAIGWALYVLEAGRAAGLYPIVCLVAAFVIGPLAGFATVGASIALLALVGLLRPGLVQPADIWQTAAFGTMAVVAVWALVDRLFLALNWYAASYAEADHRMHEAREHRGRLVQAWQQLDQAYYRLERANAALQLAWKAADEAERSKMELAINISHELRTPLNLVVGYSEMILTSPGSYGGVGLPATYRGDVTAIYRSAQHLLALTEDVLDLARLEVGRVGLHREPAALGDVIREATALIEDYAAAKGLALQVELDNTVPVLVFDRLRIRQVLINLLSNAIRLTQHGRIAVRLARDEQHARVSVIDTGPGIPPAELPHVFEPFVTSSEGGGTGHGGAGFGLPISRRFVELHGGDMGAESTVGGGTTFWFTLPLTPAEGAHAAPPNGSRSEPRYVRDSEPVLVLAHADPGLAQLLRRHLTDFRIEQANDLVEATARALELKAAAVVADLNAGEAAGSPVPVIRCPLPHVERMTANLGVADYLVKPVSREHLLAVIDRLGCAIGSVLIVDDDPRFVRLLRRMLGSDGRAYRISPAHNGEEGLARMRASPPDLLLLDLAMPGLDGVGVLRAMAGEPGLERVKVIVISAHQEGEGATPLGGEVSISKSDGFQLAELIELIGTAARSLRPSRALVATERAPAAAPLD